MVLVSGRFAGVTLTEMREKWRLQDLLDARDLVLFLGESERLASDAAKKK